VQPDRPGESTIAIVVPVLNEAALLPSNIERIRASSADEVIYVDGGSVDGTQDLLIGAGVKWFLSPPGRARQMNCGAAQCSSDIINFIHVDTVIFSDHIEAVRQAMRDEAIAGGRLDVRLSGTHPMFRIIESMINLRSRLTKVSTGDQAMFVRRTVFERLGGFPDQALLEDVEMSLRLRRIGRIACLRQQVETSSRRWEQYGIMRTVLLMWWLRFRYWLGADPADLKRLYNNPG